MRAAVARAVPDGASRFVSWCSSTISARGSTRDASSAKRIISTAPSAKLGAWKHGTPAARARSASGVGVEARRPDHDGNARGQAGVDVRESTASTAV